MGCGLSVFRAEDGIRGTSVTGVQTCALPIYYGYWFPGKENDGGAGGGFEPRPWGRAWLGNKEMGRGSWWYSGEIDLGFSGALRSAATIVADDPIFGLIVYGGELRRTGSNTEVIPKDGLRARFHIMRDNQRIHILVDRDGFAKDKPV